MGVRFVPSRLLARQNTLNKYIYRQICRGTSIHIVKKAYPFDSSNLLNR